MSTRQAGKRRVPRAYRGPMGPGSYRYRELYGVTVICRDERHQRKVYEAFRRNGHKCRVVTV
jgi:hypothetical protein